jgi:hypothetical protein
LEEDGQEALGEAGSKFVEANAKEVVNEDHGVVAFDGAITLDEVCKATPRERGKGPSEWGAQLPVIVALELYSKQTRVEGIKWKVPKGGFDVSLGTPRKSAGASHNVVRFDHQERGTG